MSQFKRTPWWPVIATLPAVISHSGHAFEATDLLAFQSGPLILRPHVGISEVYNDNIYYESAENAESDLITVFNANLTLSLGREIASNPWLDYYAEESNFISLQGGADFVKYASEKELDTINPSFNLRGRWKGNRLSLKGTDSYKLVSEPLGYGYVGSLSFEKVTRAFFNNDYLADYALSEKIRVYLGGSFSSYNYDEGTTLYDQNTTKGTLGFGYKAFTKISFFGETFYGQTGLDPNTPTMSKPAHSKFFGGYLGVERSLTERFTGTVKVGYETRMFSDDTPVPDEPLVDVALRYRFREKTSFTFNYSRQNVVSVESASVSYLQNVVGLRYYQALGQKGKMGFTAGFSASLADYLDSGYYAGRSDFTYRANLDFYYLIRAWLTATAGYQFDSYSPNEQSKKMGYIDSSVNRFTIGISVGY